MKSSLLPLITGVVFVAALECGAAKADMPDCVGIRPGMPVAEARELLKAYDSKLEVRAIELQIPELSEKPVLERLFVARNSMPRRNKSLCCRVKTAPSCRSAMGATRSVKRPSSASRI